MIKTSLIYISLILSITNISYANEYDCVFNHTKWDYENEVEIPNATTYTIDLQSNNISHSKTNGISVENPSFTEISEAYSHALPENFGSREFSLSLFDQGIYEKGFEHTASSIANMYIDSFMNWRSAKQGMNDFINNNDESIEPEDVSGFDDKLESTKTVLFNHFILIGNDGKRKLPGAFVRFYDSQDTELGALILGGPTYSIQCVKNI